MRRLLTITLLITGCAAGLRAQYVPNSAQAFQFASVYNPAFVGVEDFLDLKAGYRYQYTGFGVNSPKFVNLTANFRVKQPLDLTTNTLRTSNAGSLSNASLVPARKRIMHALGVNVFNEEVGLINRVGGGLTYALHVPLSKNVRLATGLTAMMESTKLDIGGVYLGQEPDPDTFYDHLMKGGTKHSEVSLRGGILVYGKNFYIGASYLPITTKELKNSDLDFSEPYYRGTAQFGFSFPLGVELLLKPSVMAVMQADNELLIDYSVKGFIKDKTWVGMTYRDVGALVLLVGFDFNSMLGVGYAYEVSTGEFKQFNDGSHELVLSLRLKNSKNLRAYTW